MEHPADGLPQRASPKPFADALDLQIATLYSDLDELLNLATQLRDALETPLGQKPE